MQLFSLLQLPAFSAATETRWQHHQILRAVAVVVVVMVVVVVVVVVVAALAPSPEPCDKNVADGCSSGRYKNNHNGNYNC